MSWSTIAIVQGVVIVVLAIAIVALAIIYRRVVEAADRLSVLRSPLAASPANSRRRRLLWRPRDLVRLLESIATSYAELRNFTWDAAHQLRTPLAVLSARLSTGAAADDPDAMRGDIDWMSRLVSQLLSVAGTSEVEVDLDTVFDLAAIGTQTVEALAPLAIYRGRELELVCPGGPVVVRGHASLALEAMSNLVENALSHTPAGSAVTVTISADGRADIADRGAGVPEEDRARIFQRFRQGSRPTQGGAGLGLAIVADIMRRHQGSVTCRDRPGGGTIFSLAFLTTETRRRATAPEQAGYAAPASLFRSSAKKLVAVSRMVLRS